MKKRRNKSVSILPLLFFVGLLSLFSETIRTIPVGAKSENFTNIFIKLPKLNSNLLEKKFLNNITLSTSKKNDYQKLTNDLFLIEENFNIDNELIIRK